MPKPEPLPVVVIPFYGDNLLAIRDRDGRVWVVIRQITDALGIAFSPQLTKLKGLKFATVTSIVTQAADGHRRAQSCLLLSGMPLWLARISPSKVRSELRDKLEKYQCEAADVLYRYFFGKKAERPGVESPAGTGDAVLDALAAIGQLAGAVGEVRRDQLGQGVKLQAVETRTVATDQKVEKILRQQARARAKLDEAMTPTVPAEPMTTRRALKDLLDLWIIAHTEGRRQDFRKIWRLFYRAVLRRLRIDVYGRARNQGLEKLDIIEELGSMDRAYAIAKDVLDRLTGELDAEGKWTPPAADPADADDLDPEADLEDEDLDDVADSWDEDDLEEEDS